MQTVLNIKPSCLFGGLAFLLGEAVLISVRYLKLYKFFDNGKISNGLIPSNLKLIQLYFTGYSELGKSQ